MGRPSKNYIEEARQIAKEHGGECLSESCNGVLTRVIIKCREGHIWEPRFYHLRDSKTWCEKCFIESRKHTITECCDMALEHGGRCLSTKYIRQGAKLTWQCKEGHIFYKDFLHVARGQWCTECSDYKKHTLEDCKKEAEKNKGKCLSEEYKNSHSLLLWQCKKGHIWPASLANIKNLKTWCPHCKSSKSQDFIFECLKSIYPGYHIYNNFHDFKWLAESVKRTQELDIFVAELKLAIEYDGEQHFIPVKFCGKTKEEQVRVLKRIKYLDKLKNEKVAKHPEDVKYFIRFNYKERVKLNKEYIIQKLKENQVPVPE